MADSSSQGGSSAVGSDAAASKKKGASNKHGKGKDATDDLVDEKKSSEEAIFSSMYALVKEKGDDSWQYAYIKVVSEGLVSLLIVFDPERYGWNINESNSLWVIVRWANFSNPISTIYGYNIYVYVLYALIAAVLAILFGVFVLAFQMRRAEHSKWVKPFAKTLQTLTDMLFNVLFMAILNYFLFMFSCNYTSSPITHTTFTDVHCFEMPHLGPMIIAGLVSFIFVVASTAVATAGCELNPCAKGILASPSASMKIKVFIAKSIFVLAVNILVFTAKPQTLLMCFLSLYVFYQYFDTLPFFQPYIAYIWCGMWLTISYVTCIFTTFAFAPQGGTLAFQDQMTNAVLYGVWPILVGGTFLTFLTHMLRMRHVAKFKDPEADKAHLKKIHRFSSPAEVELLSRAMRKFDLDGVIEPEAADLGELIIRAGLATYPNNPSLLILYANFMMEVRKDGPASRTQLQTVQKNAPNLIQRFQAFCTAENSKRLKESADQGMDLHSYVEFKRNYRAVLRTHKETLSQLREVWRLMLKDAPKAARIDAALVALDASIERSHRVYKRVLERYPKNGKLLKCYGRFLEDVRNDFKHAARTYADATKQGGSGNGILSMDFDFASQPGKPEMLLSLDLNEDAVIVINAEGQIMVSSQGMTTLFGYSKAELENQNVMMLMPPPFSQRHASYLQRYKDGGAPRILDSVKEVVAINKDKQVFPVQICVTKLSGVGADAVFLGLMRPIPFSKRHIRCWITPTGTILCCGPMFSALTGISPDDMVGMNFKSLLAEQDAFEALLVRGQESTQEEIDSGKMRLDINICNKYTGYIPCNFHFTMGGTDQTRLFICNLDRTDNVDDNLLVVDEAGNISFSTPDLAVTLGYTLKHFMKLKLDDLLPAPINAMHERHLRDSAPSCPVTSCRAGAVVFLINSTGVQLPVRLQMSQREEPSGLKHVIKIFKVTDEDFLDDRRIVITSSYDGIILDIEPENSTAFGFPSTLLKGLHVADVIDVFSDWKGKTGSQDMQLIMLALLDKDHEIPGSCWRVKLTPPEGQGQVVSLPSITSHRRGSTNMSSMKRQPKSAILQASLLEPKKVQFTSQISSAVQMSAAQISAAQVSAAQVAETGVQGVEEKPKVQLTLWRRDLLVGTMELDTNLRIRRAGAMAGLVMGQPSSVMMKQSLYKFLKIPKKAAWDDLMGSGVKAKGSLKTAATVGKISSTKAFEGRHPDGGSMKVFIQGAVITDATKGKQHVEICIKPDMTFTGDQSDIWAVLGLDFLDKKENPSHGGGSRTPNEHDMRSNSGSSVSGEGSDAEEAALIKAKASQAKALSSKVKAGAPTSTAVSGGQKQGALVEKWITTVGAPTASAPQISLPDPRASSESKARSTRFSLEILPPPADNDSPEATQGHKDWKKLLETIPDEANSMPKKSRRVGGKGGGKAKDGGDGGSDGGSSDGSDGEGSDGGSQGDGQSSLASSQQDHVDEILVDSRRNKLLNKLSKILIGPEMTKPIQRLKIFCIVLVLVLCVMRLACYLILDNLILTRHDVHFQVQDTAKACDRALVITVRGQVGTYCRSLPNNSQLLLAPNCVKNKIASYVYDSILSNVIEMETAHESVFLGLKGSVKKLADPKTYQTWSNSEPNLNFSIHLDTNPPQVVYDQKGLWMLGNLVIAAGREMMYLIEHNTSQQIYASRPYNFLHNNVHDIVLFGYERSLDSMMVYAQNEIQTLYISAVLLMIFEALVVIPLCILGVYFLIKKAEGVRLLHMLFMVALPSPVLRTLVSRPIKVPEDSDDDSDDDDDNDDDAHPQKPPPPSQPNASGGEIPQGQLTSNRRGSILGPSDVGIEGPRDDEDDEKVAPVTAIAAAGTISTSKRNVLPTYKHTMLFIIPLLLWFIIMIAIWAVTLSNLKEMTGPIATLNMAMRVIYRFTLLRVISQLLVTAITDAEKDQWRGELVRCIANLTSEYNTLLYGGTSITQREMQFQASSPAAAFASSVFSKMFFTDTRCFRSDQSSCALPNSTWYEATHRGLDIMMRRVIADMTLLSQEPNSVLFVNNTQFNTMFYVGINDLYGGLQTASDVFVESSTSIYTNISLIQLFLVIAAFVLAVIYLALVLRNYLILQNHEVGQVAGLLSQVPNEVDMTSHVKKVIQEGSKRKKKSKKPSKVQSVAPGPEEDFVAWGQNRSSPRNSGKLQGKGLILPV